MLLICVIGLKKIMSETIEQKLELIVKRFNKRRGAMGLSTSGYGVPSSFWLSSEERLEEILKNIAQIDVDYQRAMRLLVQEASYAECLTSPIEWVREYKKWYENNKINESRYETKNC